jgi:hypothetical protein
MSTIPCPRDLLKVQVELSCRSSAATNPIQNTLRIGLAFPKLTQYFRRPDRDPATAGGNDHDVHRPCTPAIIGRQLVVGLTGSGLLGRRQGRPFRRAAGKGVTMTYHVELERALRVAIDARLGRRPSERSTYPTPVIRRGGREADPDPDSIAMSRMRVRLAVQRADTLRLALTGPYRRRETVRTSGI